MTILTVSLEDLSLHIFIHFSRDTKIEYFKSSCYRDFHFLALFGLGQTVKEHFI
jgi:hypothetical protein